jgi:hypothetical protein
MHGQPHIRDFMMFIKCTLTHLYRKCCAQPILPLAPREKQPALHIHTHDTRESGEESDRLLQQYEHTVHRTVELARFRLVAGGGERT